MRQLFYSTFLGEAREHAVKPNFNGLVTLLVAKYGFECILVETATVTEETFDRYQVDSRYYNGVKVETHNDKDLARREARLVSEIHRKTVYVYTVPNRDWPNAHHWEYYTTQEPIGVGPFVLLYVYVQGIEYDSPKLAAIAETFRDNEAKNPFFVTLTPREARFVLSYMLHLPETRKYIKTVDVGKILGDDGAIIWERFDSFTGPTKETNVVRRKVRHYLRDNAKDVGFMLFFDAKAQPETLRCVI